MKTSRVLKQRRQTKGYLMVTLSGGSRASTRRYLVHRLVLLAFVGDPPAPRSETNHLDGVKTNNLLGNLTWCTASENQRHAIRTGISPVVKGFIKRKLSENQAREILDMLSIGFTQKRLAGYFKVSQVTVSDIKRRRTWRQI